ncbi:agmatinase [Klebsiella pneumoniae]|uniref:Agmatinase n=1 Tax=Klebsiella pneumoniae TaxID=573 RepID=A0A2X1QJN1_KLEPN|nr:agmatinase [Klebsiella pneumoniae]
MNFMPYESDADWVITGVPFDMATSGRAGGRHGPAAIRQVSTNLAWEHNRFPWNFDMRERLNVVDCGDLVYAFGDAREMSEKLQAHAEKLLAAGKRMLSFGGDHFVTLPLLRAHAKHFGKMALVHFDAHTGYLRQRLRVRPRHHVLYRAERRAYRSEPLRTDRDPHRVRQRQWLYGTGCRPG